MANKYNVIDEKTWDRAMHCMIFRNSVEPAFCVTFEADITRFRRMVSYKIQKDDEVPIAESEGIFFSVEYDFDVE